MLRIAHKRAERIERRGRFPSASVDQTEARKATVRRFGRLHRSEMAVEPEEFNDPRRDRGDGPDPKVFFNNDPT
jgi:hypothetical protein